MDADLQDSPDEIPELYRMITQDGYDLVSGWKQKRYDPLSKDPPHQIVQCHRPQSIGHQNLHDFNCGLKAYRKEVVKNIEVYGEMHRYIPYLAKNAGFKKIGEKWCTISTQIRKDQVRAEPFCKRVSGLAFPLVPFPVRHQAHALFRIAGFADVHLRLHSRGHSGCQQVVLHAPCMPYRLVTDSPYFYLSLTSMIIGTQLFVAGFLGELISRNAPERNKYQIEKTI